MLNAMNRRFRYPQNLKASAAIEYSTNNGWSWRAEALFTKTIHNAVFRNLPELQRSVRELKKEVEELKNR